MRFSSVYVHNLNWSIFAKILQLIDGQREHIHLSSKVNQKLLIWALLSSGGAKDR